MKQLMLLGITLFLCAGGLFSQHNVLINQIGYRPQDRKDFRLNVAATSFELLDNSGTVVYRGEVVQQTRPDQGALEEVWIGDFSSFTGEGEGYYIRLDDGAVSDAFTISGEVYDEVFRTAVRGLYVTRCTYAVRDTVVSHGVCHANAGGAVVEIRGGQTTYLPDDREVAGGWHNGGDYRRSTISAAQAIHRMLNTVERFPTKFDEYATTLAPGEGPTGWPDLLVEIKWGLDWLAGLQDSGGGMPTGLGPVGNTHPGRVKPQDDTSDYFIGTAHAANSGKAGAVLARAARIFATYDSDLATSYLTKAVKAYTFLEQGGGVNPPKSITTYEFNGGWREDFLWLALELYLTTGEQRYHDRFLSLYDAIVTENDGAAFPGESVSTHTMRSENLQETLLRYCLIEDLPTEASVRGSIWQAARAALDPLVGQWRNMGYGYVLPPAFWTQRHTVGNMLHKAWTLLTAYHVSLVMGPVPLKGYRDVALDQVNILLGRNPLNQTFVTGVGRRFVTDPHLRLTTLGGVPAGMPVKGPTYDDGFLAHQRANGLAIAPAPARNYIDDKYKHWVNEPDVEATAYFIAFTGYLASDKRSGISPTTPQQGALVIRARGDCGEETMELRINGERVKSWENVGTSFTDYTYAGFTGGEVSIHFTNDRYLSGGDPTCSDRNLTVDYLKACGTIYQTETEATETANCCLDKPEKLYTNGDFDFGKLTCNGSAPGLGSLRQERFEEVRVFPNPAQERVVIQGPRHYDVSLHDLSGRVVHQQTGRSGTATLAVATFPPGIYLLRVRDTDLKLMHTERLVIE